MLQESLAAYKTFKLSTDGYKHLSCRVSDLTLTKILPISMKKVLEIVNYSKGSNVEKNKKQAGTELGHT